MQRKILFVVFAEDVCRQLHAFLYALDLHRKGYQTRIIIEGMATRMLAALERAPLRLQKAVSDAKDAGIIAGACLQACSGCGDTANPSVVEAIKTRGVSFLSDLENHAGIEPFVREGYEIVAI